MLVALGLAVVPARAAALPARVTLTRLACGTVTIPDLDFLSDSFAFSGKAKTVTVSCYLIRHGDSYMLWDAGLPLSRLGAGQRSVGGGLARLDRSLVDQLRQIGIAPERVGIVALSHYHADHTGQLASFPSARVLIGRSDAAIVRGEGAAFNLDRSQFPAGANLDPVDGDRDVFGDGSIIMLATPGHTPGHHSLLVRLASGPVLLTGDLWHFAEQRPIRGVPKINTSRAETLASIDRIEQVAANLHAKIVLGHEPADIVLLPPFPREAE